MSASPSGTPHPQLPSSEQRLTPAQVDTRRVVLVGNACWLVALVGTLLVPSWHSGDRSWWPWACVTGLALGVLGLLPTRQRR